MLIVSFNCEYSLQSLNEVVNIYDTISDMSRVFELRCAVKNYEWGKLGLNSTVAQLCKSAYSDFKPEDDKPYAEMWMGTHPSGPSVIPSLDDMLLSEWIAKNPDSLGSKINHHFGNETGVPFLFKVLSVNKALSIQAHPDKETAVKLHKEFKDVYPDDNHKPEMAIALTEFEALCGFRPFEEIQQFIFELPDLQAVIGDQAVSVMSSTVDDIKDALKQCFTALMMCKEEQFSKHLSDLVCHFQENSTVSEICKPIRELFLRIHSEYPGDIGCFSLFFLNYMVLKPGEAIYLAANEPHAYLLGDCIECMACSDNVVRAGLTPKYKDVGTLCDILTYDCKPAKENLFPYTIEDSDPYVAIYDPPVKEFTVAKIEIPLQDTVYPLVVMESASLLLMVQGEAVASNSCQHFTATSALRRGSVLFISSGAKLQLHITSPGLLMFRAFCNL